VFIPGANTSRKLAATAVYSVLPAATRRRPVAGTRRLLEVFGLPESKLSHALW